MKVKELIEILQEMDPEQAIKAAPVGHAVQANQVSNVTGVGSVYNDKGALVAHTAIRYR